MKIGWELIEKSVEIIHHNKCELCVFEVRIIVYCCRNCQLEMNKNFPIYYHLS